MNEKSYWWRAEFDGAAGTGQFTSGWEAEEPSPIDGSDLIRFSVQEGTSQAKIMKFLANVLAAIARDTVASDSYVKHEPRKPEFDAIDVPTALFLLGDSLRHAAAMNSESYQFGPSHETQLTLRGTPALDYFGVCPTCHKNDGYLNIGRDHWFVCHEHRVRWLIGSNLFSAWRHESEETFRQNAERIRDYAEVEPYNDPVWNEPRFAAVRSELQPMPL